MQATDSLRALTPRHNPALHLAARLERTSMHSDRTEPAAVSHILLLTRIEHSTFRQVKPTTVATMATSFHGRAICGARPSTVSALLRNGDGSITAVAVVALCN